MKAAEFNVVKLANKAAQSQFSYYHQVMSNSAVGRPPNQVPPKMVERKPSVPAQANAK